MGSTFDVVDIPDDMKSEVAAYDYNLLETFFENPDSISDDEIHEALR